MTEAKAVAMPDTKAIAHEYEADVARARALAVTDQPSHLRALECDRALAGQEKYVAAKLDPIIADANAVHKKLTRLKAETLAPIKDARQYIANICFAYKREAERRAAEEQARLQAIARKQEEERRLAEAIELEKAGNQAEAEEAIAAPVETPTVTVQAPIAKLDTASTREIWAAQVFDKKALVRFVADNFDLLGHLLEPSMPALNDMARRQKSGMQVPGVKAFSREIIAQRRL